MRMARHSHTQTHAYPQDVAAASAQQAGPRPGSAGSAEGGKARSEPRMSRPGSAGDDPTRQEPARMVRARTSGEDLGRQLPQAARIRRSLDGPASRMGR